METTNLTAETLTKGLREREMFLYCQFEDACVRIYLGSDKKLRFFTKLRGRSEFESTEESGIVEQVLLEPAEISETDYYGFY